MKRGNSSKKICKIILTVVIILLGFQLQAQNGKRPEKSKNTVEYTINDKIVSSKEFDKFLSSLTEVKGTWFCDETATGGNTGYDAKDKQGTMYEYRAESEQNSSRNSIKKKTILK